MAAKKQAAPAETTTYLIERGLEKLRVTVPTAWKVTYGPVFQNNNRRGVYGGAPDYALRFYEAENRQRAIFMGVTAFRDLSIPVERMVEKVEGTTEHAKDHKGMKLIAQETRDEQWLKA